MKKSKEAALPLELNDRPRPSVLDLEFPIDPDFVSTPPQLDPQVMLRRIAENMPWRSTRPGEALRRLSEKIDVEFVL